MCLLTPRWHVERSRAGPPCLLGGACALAGAGGGSGAAGWPLRGQELARCRLSFQAPSITIEGFLQALSLAVDKQFEDRKKLSSCV